MTRADASRVAGFSLVELIVALTVLSVGVLGLAAAAATAQRSFAVAEAEERAARAATLVLDSLLRQDVPESGTREVPGARVTWIVSLSPVAIAITANVAIADGDRTAQVEYHASRARAAIR